MDEITLIKSYGAATPDPSAATVGEARARLVERMGRRGFLGNLPLGRAGALAGAATLAVAAAVVLPSLGEESGGGATAQAAQALYAAAEVAEEQPWAALGAGQYIYSSSETTYVAGTVAAGAEGAGQPVPIGGESPYTVIVPAIREVWIAADGSGRMVVTPGEPTFLSEEDRLNWEAAGQPDLRVVAVDQAFPAGGLPYADPALYPTDVAQLRQVVLSEFADPDWNEAQTIFNGVGALLKESSLPPELRSALFELVASVDGIELIGEVIDPAGRAGLAVGLDYEQDAFVGRYELIFDPETSALLAERDVLFSGTPWVDGEAGTVIHQAVYELSGVVGSTEEVPATQ